jgi:MFS family permease
MAARMGAKYAAALRIRDLRTLIIAFVVDGAASWSYVVVLTAYVFERTHSAGWITGLVTVRFVTGMLLGGYAGVLADRYDRRRVLLVSAAAATVATLLIAAIVESDGPLVLLLAASALLTAVCTPIRPTSGALIPEVVDESELIAANSIFAFLESVIVVLGPGVGALLLLTGDPVYGVLLNAASFVVAGALYLMLTVRSRGSAEPGGNIFKQWIDGVAVLGQHRKALVLTGFLVLDSAAINAANVLLPALAEHLHSGASAYSLLLAFNAFGGVVAAGLANRLSGSSRLATVIMASIVLECVPLWLCVYAHYIGIALVLQLASGVGMVIVDVLAFTALQRDLPRDVLGRVLSAVDVLMLGSSVLTTVVASALYSTVGLGWALGLLGIGFPLLGLLGLPALRAVDRQVAERLAALAPRIELLDALALFDGAPRSLVERLAESAEPRTVAAGTVLIRQGDEADALWLLRTGRLEVTAVIGGRSDALPDVTAPGYVGELGLLHKAARSATVTTASDCELLRIPGPEFLSALSDAQPSPTMIGRAEVRLARTARRRPRPRPRPVAS